MPSFRLSNLFFALLSIAGAVRAVVEPTAVYDGGLQSDSDILLRIASGGAGQQGLVKAIADAYIQESVKNGSKPFKVSWVLSDTTFSIKNLQSGDADIGITYNPAAEKIAGDQGIIDPKTYYLFRDHFLIVGPKENPASISNCSDVQTIFAKLYQSADKNSANTTVPTRWLSRYDKSATNMKESQLWLSIGQVPWSMPYSTWYHQFIAFPVQALTTAVQLKEYTLTDRATYLSISPEVASQTVIFKASSDDADDPLLNPAHLLVGKKTQNETLAYHFADWATGVNGQKVITDFKKNGQQLYSGAPKDDTRQRN
ncbi:extracellular solute-binding protein family 1 [Polyplosphaeria fusca]|uniref:Extracellular solute-binding protein family 1 n=1 Tax=Polyplosphaeria fusca TaxID=682080 RepID=A0A9P4QR56_9PLEO|nr:extracellular solute-binding protein family 1 [Polyplosphaeria fusca]